MAGHLALATAEELAEQGFAELMGLVVDPGKCATDQLYAAEVIQAMGLGRDVIDDVTQ